MTIEDYCISLNPNNFFLVVLGVVDMCHDLLSKVFGSTLVGTIDLKYDFVHRSSSIFRQLEISLKFGESFVNIEAKSRAIKAKKKCLALVLALVSKFSRVSVEVFQSIAMFRSVSLSSPK